MFWFAKKIGIFREWSARSRVGRVLWTTYCFLVVATGLATGLLAVIAAATWTPIAFATLPLVSKLQPQPPRWRTVWLIFLGTAGFAAFMVSLRKGYLPLEGDTLKLLAGAGVLTWLSISAWLAARLAAWRPQRLRRGYHDDGMVRQGDR